MAFVVFVIISLIVLVCEREAASQVYKPDVTKLVDYPHGLNGTEGPVFDKDGNFFMLVMKEVGSSIIEVDLNKRTTSVLAKPVIETYPSIATGADTDISGNLWIADRRLGLLKVTHDGKYQQMATRDSLNETIQGLNDLVFDYHGTIWATAPDGKIATSKYVDGYNEEKSWVVNGSIYSYLPALDKFTKLDTGFHYCNGVAVKHSKDGTPELLLVTELFVKKVWAYDITGPGEINLTSKRVWGSHSVLGSNGQISGFDGADFDEEGNLLVAHWGASSVEVFGPDGGSPIARIEMPVSRVTNLEFKPGSNQVYVTDDDSFDNRLWMFEWINKGCPKYRDLDVSVDNERNEL